MTKLRKKLLLSVLTLALTFIALGSTTFAWFTLGNKATANAFTGSVQGGEGIDIAFVKSGKEITQGSETNTLSNLNEYQWKMSVNLADSADVDLSKLKFRDLTSADGQKITDITRNEGTAKANTDYVEIALYVRSMGVLNALYVSSLTDVDSAVVQWYPDVDVEDILKIGEAKAFNPLNAVRVSFTNDKATTTKVLEFTVGENRGSADATTEGFAYKYALAKDHQKVINAKVDNNTGMFPATETISQIPENKEVNLGTSVNLLGETATANDAFVSYTDQQTGITYYIYKVTFRVWMEGWDGDCINAILTKPVKLGFTLQATYATQASTQTSEQGNQ